MVEKWVVTVEAINDDGKVDKLVTEHDTFQYATRDLFTYNRRGYIPIKFMIERDWRLF